MIALFAANDLDKKKLLFELERLSFTDTFTGLYNRNKYIKTIEQIISDKLDEIGIVYLDTNGLKERNDKFGHNNGDNLIISVASLLK